MTCITKINPIVNSKLMLMLIQLIRFFKLMVIQNALLFEIFKKLMLIQCKKY